MVEEDAIHFSPLHFEGDALEWLQHGMIIQGYSLITSFDDFARGWLRGSIERRRMLLMGFDIIEIVGSDG